MRSNNNPLSDFQSKDKENQKSKRKISPQFENLKDPDVIKNHLNEIKETKETSHQEILVTLLKQVNAVNFEDIANPNGHDDFKLTNKHYTIISIEEIIGIAKQNKWGLCKHNDMIYLFNGTHWQEISKDSFQKFLGDAALKMKVPVYSAKYFRFKKELYEQFLATAYLDRKEVDVNKVLINLENGTFEIDENGTNLRPFHKNDFITYKLPFKYDKKAEAPIFLKYLNRVLPDIERQKVLSEYLAYIFIKNNSNRLKEEKALILYGTGANGKSVFFEIVSALLGSENTSNYSLQSLTNENGYFRAKIGNKLVNYASEINAKLESSLFKQLVSGEPVEARLPYGQPFTLYQYAKLIFNCNELPKEVEHTNAFFRRFLIIPFDVTIPKEEQDKTLHSKIIENELSGVFNWVLEGLDRLLKQKGFSNCSAAEEAVEEYRKQSDSVNMFIEEENYHKSVNDYTLIKDLYPLYKIYCNDDGLRPVSKRNFTKRLRNLGFDVNHVTGNKLAVFISLNEVDF
jgi:putative DNA primase/helicase